MAEVVMEVSDAVAERLRPIRT